MLTGEKEKKMFRNLLFDDATTAMFICDVCGWATSRKLREVLAASPLADLRDTPTGEGLSARRDRVPWIFYAALVIHACVPLEPMTPL